MTIKKIALALMLLTVVLIAGALAWALRYPNIAPIARPDPGSFDRNLVERGELLVGLGNCQVCHTRPGGLRFAGGLPLPTPFGVIHTTNITPDPETGIGAWSEAAFIRAMREGVDRNGSYLYPAFPYDYFTNTSDEDLQAIYAFLMTRDPVSDVTPENGLGFPFNQRLLLAGWNLLFHKTGPFQPDPAQNEEWNRGAYLVEGLGHCGACHTPRNRFGAAAKSGPTAFAGGHAEGWYVPPLNDTTPAPVPWTQNTLVNYLIDGWDSLHGIAAGPMTPIVNDLYEQSEDDVFAIAAYVMWVKGGEPDQTALDARIAEARAFAERVEWGHAEAPAVPDDPAMQLGAKVFEAQCATCHKVGGKTAPLALSTVTNAPDASNLIRVVFTGVQPPPYGSPDRSMPARAIQISDDEMVALAAFVRARFSLRPEWHGLPEQVKAARDPK